MYWLFDLSKREIFLFDQVKRTDQGEWKLSANVQVCQLVSVTTPVIWYTCRKVRELQKECGFFFCSGAWEIGIVQYPSLCGCWKPWVHQRKGTPNRKVDRCFCTQAEFNWTLFPTKVFSNYSFFLKTWRLEWRTLKHSIRKTLDSLLKFSHSKSFPLEKAKSWHRICRAYIKKAL